MTQAISDKLSLLRQQLIANQLDAFIQPSNDEFQSEYVPDYTNRLKFITGFTGSNGALLITHTAAIFFTDGRYFLQAKEELGPEFQILDIQNLYCNEFLQGNIGYDAALYTEANLAKYQNCQLVEVNNLIDLIWLEKESAPSSQIFTYPLKYAGETSLYKQQQIKKYLQQNKIDALIITDSSSICWLLNIRAHDVKYTPVLLSYLIFHQNAELELFSHGHLKDVNNYSLAEFTDRAKLLKDKLVQLDPNSASSFLSKQFTKKIFKPDPCVIAKACKNKIEINCARKVHIADGAALCKLLYWLERNYHGQSEMSVAAKLLEFRQASSDFLYPSFPTIAGFKEHGAIIHYQATSNTNKALDSDGLLLLDSGGQYFGGTTDITRVIPCGKTTYEQKLNYTLVLKGHIALANCKFPLGCSGADLDALARQYLWQYQQDYAHGTGHGVGSCLSVHEGPQRISKMGHQVLLPGMIISNEPGYYEADEYGLRIESLMLVAPVKHNFLCFEMLSLAPLEPRLILKKLLNQDERKWIHQYHQKIYKKLSPHLNYYEKCWLKSKL